MSGSEHRETTSLSSGERNLSRTLRERVKELNCLFEVVSVLVDQTLSVPEALKRIAAVVPGGFSFPEITQVQISYDRYFCTEGAAGALSVSIERPISDDAGVKGFIKVGMIETQLKYKESFLPEEKDLLVSITDIVAAIIHQIATRDSLANAFQDLKAKNIALREVLFQIESERQRYHDSVWRLLAVRVFPLLRENRRIDRIEHQQLVADLEQELELLVSAHNVDSPDRLSILSPREFQACTYIKTGMSNKEIGDLMGVSSTTVEKHRQSIRRKLGLANTKVNLAVYLRSL